jgi:nucleotide-binding universal stress UspA family protein
VRWAIDDGAAGAALELELAAATGTAMSAEFDVEVGMPTDVLSELGDRVDMLVLGSGRSGPRGRVQPGATGRGTLRLVTCPVLVVPRPAAVAS